jgi:4-hydroxy-3-methylbut-2-en-1-yl diphosphate reductase
VIVFSAHGSPPDAYANSRRLGHTLIDATCPLVTKVHHEARRHARDGRDLVLIGHAGHQEVVGTMGQAPRSTVLVETPEDVDTLDLDAAADLAYITQTTLSLDETRAVVDRLRQRFPQLRQPKSDDICYATQNRQDAVKQLAERCDLILVVGSQTSSNSKRLVEVSRDRSVPAYLVDEAAEIDPAWLEGVEVVGLTSGASAPEVLVEEVVDWFRARGTEHVDTLVVVDEDVEFSMPSNLARKLRARSRIRRSPPRRRPTAGRPAARAATPAARPAGTARRRRRARPRPRPTAAATGTARRRPVRAPRRPRTVRGASRRRRCAPVRSSGDRPGRGVPGGGPAALDGGEQRAGVHAQQ